MADQNIKGRRFTGKRRAPKAVDERRICAQRDCETVLTRYNKKPTCYSHSPVKFPRVRGRDVRPDTA